MITGVRFALVCEGHCVSRVNHSDSRVNRSAPRVFHFISRVNHSNPRVFHFVSRVSLFALTKNLFAYSKQRGLLLVCW